MRPVPNLAIERFRARTGPMGSSRFDGNNGVFLVSQSGGSQLQTIASDGEGWDHVSVVVVDNAGHPVRRTPTWAEMCMVKDLFFAPDECVVQYHPALADYRNAHEFCLHLWRPQDQAIPTPNPEMVAPASSAKAGAR